MDQEIVDQMTQLDQQIDNLNLNAQIKVEDLRTIQEQRSAIDSKSVQFKEAEQKRVEEFKRDITQDINRLRTRLERLLS